MWQAWFLEVQPVPAPVYATEAEDAQEDNGDDVEITLDDKPYLALGADLTADQQHTVLSYMGIEAADFDKYDVVYVSNAEEHQYLDSYVPKKQIGTKALSSVLVSLADSGNGLKVSTYNINYCTAGMYKNALATAGVEDANVIVAGPFPLSGTAALVGTFEAYEKLTERNWMNRLWMLQWMNLSQPEILSRAIGDSRCGGDDCRSERADCQWKDQNAGGDGTGD